jgi:hypothetical protein
MAPASQLSTSAATVTTEVRVANAASLSPRSDVNDPNIFPSDSVIFLTDLNLWRHYGVGKIKFGKPVFD